MGLDMYLSAKRFYWHDEELPEIKNVPEGFSVSQIEVQAMYWRKANAIHNWFVENVQDGEDDCRSCSVSREQLEKLADICEQVATHKIAPEEGLPTINGFFFGDTEYGEYYFEEVERTAKELKTILSSFDDTWRFEYMASW